jgi:hypothetical protein
MAKAHRSARGDSVDMDFIRLSNESTIAIGNMKTNARGDELGPGGKVVKNKAQVMQEYHKLNTPVADNKPIVSSKQALDNKSVERKLLTPTPVNKPVISSSATPEYVKPRGSLAEAVAGETEVTQELLEPAASRSTDSGVSRI